MHRPKPLIHPLQAVLIALSFILALPPAAIAAAGVPRETAEILDSAEALFQKMAKRDFPALWNGLTQKSRQSIIRSVQKAEAKVGREHTEESLLSDFRSGGPFARGYWEAYLSSFDPRTVLEESRWTMGTVAGNRAEIILRYRKSDHDAHLQMFREDGRWKVGLDETFSTRQWGFWGAGL